MAYVTPGTLNNQSLPASVTSQLLGVTMRSQGSQVNTNTNSGVGRKREILNVGEWTDAMLIYLSLVIQKHPELTLPLIKYCTMIREASSRFGTRGALAYDKHFRMKMAVNPSRRWDMMDNEAYLLLLMPQTLSQRGQSYNPQKQGGPLPPGQGGPFRRGRGGTTLTPGVCWQYNKDQCSRQNCKFPHKCSFCGKPHPQSKCYAAQAQAGNKGNNGPKSN